MPVKVLAHETRTKRCRDTPKILRNVCAIASSANPKFSNELTNIIIIPPHVTFTQRATLLYGGRRVELIFVGGHTPATSVVWLPEEKICFVGDIVWVDQHPYMAQGNTQEWLRSLEMIRNIGADYLVPGHGPAALEATYRVGEYIEFMRGPCA